MTSGIYAIVGPNGVYIGRAEIIETRLRSHMKCLTENRHECKRLQAAWNLFGAEEFRNVILFQVDPYPRLIYAAAEQVALSSVPQRLRYNTLRAAIPSPANR